MRLTTAALLVVAIGATPVSAGTGCTNIQSGTYDIVIPPSQWNLTTHVNVVAFNADPALSATVTFRVYDGANSGGVQCISGACTFWDHDYDSRCSCIDTIVPLESSVWQVPVNTVVGAPTRIEVTYAFASQPNQPVVLDAEYLATDSSGTAFVTNHMQPLRRECR